MECGDVNKLIDPYLDRKLNASAIEEVEAHVAGCDACRREWGGLLAMLGEPEPVEVPAGLRDRVIARLDREFGEAPAGSSRPADDRPWVRASRALRYVSGLAACVAIFVSGWYLSGWWQASKTELTLPDDGDSQVVMISPWLMSSMARAAAMPGPMSPAVVLAQGIVPEMMIAMPATDEPRIRVHRPFRRGSAQDTTAQDTTAQDTTKQDTTKQDTATQRATTQPAGPAPGQRLSPEFQVLPLVPRYLGA